MNEIQIEPTANPKVLKFVADYTLLPGSLELDRNSDISEIPIAEELFNFPFVDQIFITANFIAVSKQDLVEWDMVKDNLKNVIEDQLLENPRIYRKTIKQVFPIYAEMTPNPAVMKFVSDRIILDGFVEVKSKEEASDVPLAEAIYDQFDFVEEVFISDNFVAVTGNNTVEWHEVMMTVRSFIAEYLQEGKPVTERTPQEHGSDIEQTSNREYNEEEKQIVNILNEYIAPAVENDGGKISLMEYDSNSKTAKMLLQGACSGCPSSTATLKGGIENVLKQFLPNLVENVEAVNG